MPRNNISALLQGWDRRSVGHSDYVAALVARNPARFPQLIKCLRSAERVVRMRAADAAEKVTRGNPGLLRPNKKELLRLMAETEEQELRWHLAVMVPRLPLNNKERLHTASLLRVYLSDASSIVKTFALQGLADLAHVDPAMRPDVIEILREARLNGTRAMKARSRKLLLHLGQPPAQSKRRSAENQSS